MLFRERLATVPYVDRGHYIVVKEATFVQLCLEKKCLHCNATSSKKLHEQVIRNGIELKISIICTACNSSSREFNFKQDRIKPGDDVQKLSVTGHVRDRARFRPINVEWVHAMCESGISQEKATEFAELFFGHALNRKPYQDIKDLVWCASQLAGEEMFDELVKELLERDENVTVALDCGWGKRGRTAAHGQTPVHVLEDNVFIGNITKMKAWMKDGRLCIPGDYGGASGNMEAECLKDYIERWKDLGFLKLIRALCVDKDGSIAKVWMDHPDTCHIPIEYDLGHSGTAMSRTMQGHLLEAKAGAATSVALSSRVKAFFIKLVSRAKYKFGNDINGVTLGTGRNAPEVLARMREWFLEKWAYMPSHYLKAVCPNECPCQDKDDTFFDDVEAVDFRGELDDEDEVIALDREAEDEAEEEERVVSMDNDDIQ